MQDAALQALAWYLEKAESDPLMTTQTGLAGPVFFNAHPPTGGLLEDLSKICAVQPFRPVFNALVNAGLDATADRNTVSGNRSAAIIGLSRMRALNEAYLTCAASRCADGGLILIVGTKTDGVDALRKRLQTAGCLVESHSKHHAKVLRLTLDPQTRAVFEAFENRPEAGLFNAGKTDAGSRLLIEMLDQRVKGAVADFCAGSGVLAKAVLERSLCTSLDLYEANHDALSLARREFAMTAPPLQFHWHDLMAEPVERRFDTIVMNPPFHTGRAAEPDIGKAMIARAASALRARGTLRMVANVTLPYESVLAERFRGHRLLATQDGFKVLDAWL